MFKSRIAKQALGLVLGLGLSQVATADPYSYLDQGVPNVVFKSIKLGHTNPNKILHLNLNLAPSSPGALEAYANSVSDPKSPNYRKFLKPEDIGSRFGMSNTDFNKVVAYLQSNGFNVKLAAKNHFNIMADATVANVEKAFKTVICDYQTLSTADKQNQQFYSNTTGVAIPSALKPMIRSVSGLESHTKGLPLLVALTPNQARTLYGLATDFTSYKGEGRNVAISSWDGFALSNVPIFLNAFSLPYPAAGQGTNIKVFTIDGGSQSGTQQGEADLDIQMVLGQAPLCNFYVYDGGANPIDVLTQETNDNIADIISESYGWDLSTSDALACHVAHLAMTAQGITYMNASGDSGTNLNGYDYPDFEPETLKVGGTIATVDASGNRLGEVNWVGSGGGWSTRTDSFNQLPSWQKGPGVPVGYPYRLFPDVALNAAGNGTGAYQFVFKGALNSDYDGTSFASPVFAGGLAVAEEKLVALSSLPPSSGGRPRLGRIQDLIYQQQGRSDVWFDIVSGPSTGTLPDGTIAMATPGWDFTSGWGAINFDAFVTAVAAPPITLFPSSVALLTGKRLSGTNLSLDKIDGNAYNLATTEYSGVGQEAGEKVNFVVPSGKLNVVSMNITTTNSTNPLATVQIFAYNWVTNRYDLLKSFTGSSGYTTDQVSVINPSNYVKPSNGLVTLATRALAPDRLATGGFTYSTDQTNVVVQSIP